MLISCLWLHSLQLHGRRIWTSKVLNTNCNIQFKSFKIPFDQANLSESFKKFLYIKCLCYQDEISSTFSLSIFFYLRETEQPFYGYYLLTRKLTRDVTALSSDLWRHSACLRHVIRARFCTYFRLLWRLLDLYCIGDPLKLVKQVFSI